MDRKDYWMNTKYRMRKETRRQGQEDKIMMFCMTFIGLKIVLLYLCGNLSNCPLNSKFKSFPQFKCKSILYQPFLSTTYQSVLALSFHSFFIQDEEIKIHTFSHTLFFLLLISSSYLFRSYLWLLPNRYHYHQIGNNECIISNKLEFNLTEINKWPRTIENRK